MPDLNDLMTAVQKRGSDIQKQVHDLLVDYEELYRQSNNRFMQERTASGNFEGLDDFHRLVQILRRNRDVVSSLFRGIRNIRSLEKYRFVEEEIEEAKEAKAKEAKSKKRRQSRKKAKEPTVNPHEIEKIEIPQEVSDG